MIPTLKKRREFVEISKDGTAAKTPTMTVLFLKAETCKVGYTASRRVGNAVLRNRAKRRLRALAALSCAELMGKGSFVLIANHRTPKACFQQIQQDFNKAISSLV